MPQPDRIVLEAIVPKGPITKVRRELIVAKIQDVQNAVNSRMAKYPPQRGGSTYRRTGEYGRRWTTRGPSVVGKDLVAEVGSNLEYAPYVGGLKTQRPGQTKVAARAGWPSVEDVGQAEWQKRERAIIDAIQGK